MVPSAARIAVGLTFLLAGILKLADRDWAPAARAVGVPQLLTPLVAPAEVVLGAALVAGLAAGVLPWVAGLFLMAFTIVLGRVMRQPVESRPTCACFGRWSSGPVGPWSMVRNAALMVLTVVSAVG